MVTKMILLALCAVAAMGSAVAPAAKYPAGVNPHACPNYPYCDNVALAAHSAGAVHAPYAAPAYAHYGVHGPVAAAYPAGVDPHTCPNYPYCDNVAVHTARSAHGWAAPAWTAHGAWAAAPHAAWTGVAHGGWAGAHGVAHGAARYPAGVNPHTCPNYPYCH
ncbi:hypothetical protein J437_LFUL011002 [Ladona fulva]|uniref:Cuticle protein CPCFC domain-containing protein n=1 Tax=Ladona fulva TaxID=123851 RepID=A0A8K0KL20_LADFU|nr:hypothetical protein J437_LFUL011002 [Ladona fulva]